MRSPYYQPTPTFLHLSPSPLHSTLPVPWTHPHWLTLRLSFPLIILMHPILWSRNADVCASLLISLNLNTDYIFRILIATNTWYIGNLLHANHIASHTNTYKIMAGPVSATFILITHPAKHSTMDMECGFRLSPLPSTLPPHALLSQYHHLHYYLILSTHDLLVRFCSFGIPHFSIPLHFPRLSIPSYAPYKWKNSIERNGHHWITYRYI